MALCLGAPRRKSRKTYVLRLLSCLLGASLVGGSAAVELVYAPIEYTNVQAAFEALLARKDVAIDVQAGWSVITERSGLIWTFVPLAHPGYPSVMRQRVTFNGVGGVKVDMAVLCQAKKMPCESVITELRLRNRVTAEQLKYLAAQSGPIVEIPQTP